MVNPGVGKCGSSLVLGASGIEGGWGPGLNSLQLYLPG